MARILLILTFTLMILSSLLNPEIVAAQTTEETEAMSQGEEGTQGNTQTQTQPSAPIIDNTGIVYPRQDLDNFGLSSLGESTGLGEGLKGSTLGKDATRKSNLEVNKPRQKKESEQDAEESAEESDTGSSEFESVSESTQVGYTSPGKREGLFTWKDQNGVVHVTNDLGSVPVKYQAQIIEESQKAKSEESLEP